MHKVGDRLKFWLVNSQEATYGDIEYNLLAMDAFYNMKGYYSWIHRNMVTTADPVSENLRFLSTTFAQQMDVNFLTDDGSVRSTIRALPNDPQKYVQTSRQREDYGWYIPADAAE